MRDHRAIFLRDADHIDQRRALALHEGCLPQNMANGNHTRAADARHQNAPRLVKRWQVRFWHDREWYFVEIGHGRPRALDQLASLHRHKAWAEALDAGEVLVAGRLIDLALAPELGLDRLDRHAIRLYPAIAATLADQFIDEHTLGRIGERALAPPPAFFGSASLVIDDDAGALHPHHPGLHGLQFATVMK